jgi:hypothetical protein
LNETLARNERPVEGNRPFLGDLEYPLFTRDGERALMAPDPNSGYDPAPPLKKRTRHRRGTIGTLSIGQVL